MEQVFRSPETTRDDFLQRLQRSIEHYKRSNSTSEGNRKILVKLNTNFWRRKLTQLFFFPLWHKAYARNVGLCFLHWQYTDLFLFWFVFEHCLCSTLRLWVDNWYVIWPIYFQNLFSSNGKWGLWCTKWISHCVHCIQSRYPVIP